MGINPFDEADKVDPQEWQIMDREAAEMGDGEEWSP
jgi:hypothetical protein